MARSQTCSSRRRRPVWPRRVRMRQRVPRARRRQPAARLNVLASSHSACDGHSHGRSVPKNEASESHDDRRAIHSGVQSGERAASIRLATSTKARDNGCVPDLATLGWDLPWRAAFEPYAGMTPGRVAVPCAPLPREARRCRSLLSRSRGGSRSDRRREGRALPASVFRARRRGGRSC